MMNEEFESLVHNKTLEMRELPHGRKPIGCKWVYLLKTKPNGSLNKFKATLVTRDFTQQKNATFRDFFSSEVKYDNIKIVNWLLL